MSRQVLKWCETEPTKRDLRRKVAGIIPGMYHGDQDGTFIVINEIDVDGATLQYRTRFDRHDGKDHLNTDLVGYVGESNKGKCLNKIFEGDPVKRPEEKMCRYLAHALYV